MPTNQQQITGDQIKTGTINNANIASDAAIQTSKLQEGANFLKNTAHQNLNSYRLTGVGEPQAASDAATKAYVDATKQGLDIKDSVRCATTENITLSGLQTIDGITVTANERVLVKNQSNPVQNGIYVASASGWSRATDADDGTKFNTGAYIYVEAGTTQNATGWVLGSQVTAGNFTSANKNFIQFNGAGSVTAGNGLTQSGNTLSVLKENDTLNVTSNGVGVNFSLFQFHIVPSGSIDGFNTTFTLPSDLADNSLLLVFVNGVLQILTTHYSISGADTIELEFAPKSGDDVRCFYLTIPV